MARTFAYVRVSTATQTVENQVQEIRAAGFDVTARRTVADTVSGSSAIEQRPGFIKLLDRLEDGDVLIVTKLDRLGRNAIDIASTVKRLAEAGVRVHCLQLGGTDLTSSSGKMILTVIGAMAEFERDLLIERVQSGLKRAKAGGMTLGRKPTLSADQRADVVASLKRGEDVSKVAKRLGVSRMTVMRIRDAAGVAHQVTEEWRAKHEAGMARSKGKARGSAAAKGQGAMVLTRGKAR